MAVTVVYDSGTSVPLNPDVWLSYRRSTSPGTAPIVVNLRIVPTANPQATWNLLGYACIEVDRQGARTLGAQTPIPSIVTELAPSVTLYSVELRPGSNRVDGFRGVYWNINRWVGTYRAIVTTID